jgi:hypothetical protein
MYMICKQAHFPGTSRVKKLLMNKDESLEPKYPGCPPGWEPPIAPVLKYSTAVICINAFLIERIISEIARYIDARYVPGTVSKEVRAFFSEATPEVNNESEDEEKVKRLWSLTGKKGNFWIDMEHGEGYFFCNMSVLKDQYYEAKQLLENLRIKADQED